MLTAYNVLGFCYPESLDATSAHFEFSKAFTPIESAVPFFLS
jgi:hypothetical protein